MDVKTLIKDKAEEYKDDLINFLIDLIKIRSVSGEEEEVALRIQSEMEKVGFDEVFIDKLGNVIGRIGSGKTILAMDAHIDTADAGDTELWQVNPFEATIVDDRIYGRGTAGQKGSIAAMIYAGKIIKELDLEDDYTLYVTGTVLKEECEGLAWNYIINEDNISPNFVVIADATNLNINRGNRGSVNLEIITKGLSCDAGSPQRGVNAIYKTIPIIQDIEEQNKNFKSDGFLGEPSISVTHINYNTPSRSSVPDQCTIEIQRRTMVGESTKKILKETKALKGAENSMVRIVEFQKPSYTGIVYPIDKYSQAWLLEEDNILLKAASEAFKKMFNRDPKIDKWSMGTNGSVTMGVYKIPTIGFGPGNEMFVHGPREHVEIEDLIKASQFYAMFPKRLSKWINVGGNS